MENRKAHRVVFERGYAANMMAIDGTWRRPCTMEDVSDTGARLTIDGSIEGLNLKEFFLLLSTMGKAYRRCQLVPRHSGSDWLIPSQFRMGRSFGGTRIWMLLATPG
jgi:hypothetical protein